MAWHFSWSGPVRHRYRPRYRPNIIGMRHRDQRSVLASQNTGRIREPLDLCRQLLFKKHQAQTRPVGRF